MDKLRVVSALRRQLEHGEGAMPVLALDGLGFRREGKPVLRPAFIVHLPPDSQPVHSAILGENDAFPGEYWEVIRMVGGRYDPHRHTQTPVCLTMLTPVLAFVNGKPRTIMPGEDLALPAGCSHGFYGPGLFVSRQLEGRRIDLGGGQYDLEDDTAFEWPPQRELDRLWAGLEKAHAAWPHAAGIDGKGTGKAPEGR